MVHNQASLEKNALFMEIPRAHYPAKGLGKLVKHGVKGPDSGPQLPGFYFGFPTH